MFEMIVGFAVFFGLTILGQEIFLSMAAASAAVLLVQHSDFTAYLIIPQSMLFGIEGLELAAIPLFILAGELMNSGGITRRLVLFCRVIIGHIRGGLSLAAVLVEMVLSGVSGSAVADASATGTLLIPAMKEDGYDVDYAAALIASAATIGPIIPPSIGMIVYGILANVSVGKLFLSGAVPGVLMGLALMGICYVVARRHNYSKLPRSSLREVLRASYDSFLALIMPLIIIAGVAFGVVTVTEIAGIAVVYAAVVGGFIYREIELADVPRMLADSALMSAVVLITLATANTFGWLMTFLQIGARLSALVAGISDNPLVIMLVINFFFLLIGCVFEPLPAMLIFIPMLLPVVKSLGIDLVYFGLIIVFDTTMGLLEPPIGLNLYIAATIAKRPVEGVIRKVLPFYLVLLVVLILCTCVPEIVLWLPRLIMP